MRIDLKRSLKNLKTGQAISIILLLLMLLSTVAGFLLQAMDFGNKGNGQPEVQIPDTNIIEYALTVQQKDYLIQQGKTIIEYRYQLTCEECGTQRATLGAIASTYSDQVFLEDIVDGSAVKPRLEMSSYNGRRLVTTLTADEMMKNLCEIIAEPPVDCIRLGV